MQSSALRLSQSQPCICTSPPHSSRDRLRRVHIQRWEPGELSALLYVTLWSYNGRSGPRDIVLCRLLAVRDIGLCHRPNVLNRVMQMRLRPRRRRQDMEIACLLLISTRVHKHGGLRGAPRGSCSCVASFCHLGSLPLQAEADADDNEDRNDALQGDGQTLRMLASGPRNVRQEGMWHRRRDTALRRH